MTPTRVSLACALFFAACSGPTDFGEQAGHASANFVICPDGATQEGIDVSSFQGTVDWDAAVADGVTFAIARVSQGDLMDPEFETNWRAIEEAGALRGAYQFFEPGGDPAEQAQIFVDAVGELGPCDLPGTLDVQTTDGLTPNEIAAKVATWVDIVSAGTGRLPMIYTGRIFWNDNVQTDQFANLPLWLAQYGGDCPNVPDAWSSWTMWQYTPTGSVAGIDGSVNLDVFNGSFEELNDFAANGLRAGVVSVDYTPTMAPGETATVTLVLENLGARTWTANTKLGTTVPRDRDSPFAAPSWDTPQRPTVIPRNVATGETVTLELDITAPMEPGQYTEHFNLLEEGFAWFSDTPPGGGPPDDAIALNITVGDDMPGTGGTGGSANPGGGGCSVGRLPSEGIGWLLVLSAIVLCSRLRRRRRRGM